MIDDRSAFIQNIVANPLDDFPRLVMADWLTGVGG
jgi:uncharacterized protein (TIGR02996 family)